MFVGGDGMVVSSVLREEGLSSVWGSGFFVVSGFGYRVFLGDLFPFLFFVGPEQGGAFPLFGDVFLVFSGRFCRWCGCVLDGFSRLGLCGCCYSSRRGVRYRLLVEGYRSFGDVSVFESESDLVFGDYVLYFGVFGSAVKVGVSRFDRGGVSFGFVDRLVEQGFSSAVAIGFFDLVSAQDLEREVAGEFGLACSLGFFDKLELLGSREFSLGSLMGLVGEVLDFIGGGARVVWFGSFSWPCPSGFDYVWSGDVLSGSLVGFRGNLGFFSDGSSVFVVNFSDLVGRGIVDWEV